VNPYLMSAFHDELEKIAKTAVKTDPGEWETPLQPKAVHRREQ
jgi:hypothetical protein